MPVTPITTELGHSLPPEESHTITLHAPGWDTAIRFRNKDMELFSKMVSLYPRFAPWGEASQVRTSPSLTHSSSQTKLTHLPSS